MATPPTREHEVYLLNVPSKMHTIMGVVFDGFVEASGDARCGCFSIREHSVHLADTSMGTRFGTSLSNYSTSFK